MTIEVTIVSKKTFTEEEEDIKRILYLGEDETLTSLSEEQLKELKEYYASEEINALADVEIKQS